MLNENIAAERALLGAILLNGDAIFHCGNLRPEDFNFDSHRLVFRALHDLASLGQPRDIITLTTKLQSEKHLGKVGGPEFISGLLDGVPERPAEVEHYAKMVSELARRRQLVALCNRAVQQTEDQSESTEDCISVTLERILALAGNLHTSKSIRVSEYSYDVYKRVKELAETPLSDLPVGLPTGIAGLDRLTTGMREGELWVLASWTGEGKTVLATQMIVENAKRDVPILWFTQEMNRRQVLLRMIPQLTDGVVKGRHLRDPRHMTPAHLLTFLNTQDVVNTWPLYVHDAAGLEITELYAHAMAMWKKEKIRLVVVDYLQLIKGRGRERYERVSDVSNVLREFGKDTGCTVLAVSQMARPENREKRPPRIFDLKESGSIEQDAHVIVMPYRPQEKSGAYTGDDVIIIGKQREGPTGSIKTKFDSLRLIFESGHEPCDNEQLDF